MTSHLETAIRDAVEKGGYDFGGSFKEEGTSLLVATSRASLPTSPSDMKYVLILLLIALVVFVAWQFVSPKTRCELSGGKWNFTFPSDASQPSFVCDPPGTIRFGMMNGTAYGSDGSAYEMRAKGNAPVSRGVGAGGGGATSDVPIKTIVYPSP